MNKQMLMVGAVAILAGCTQAAKTEVRTPVIDEKVQPGFVVTFDYSSAKLTKKKDVVVAASKLGGNNILLVSHTRGDKDSGEFKLATNRLSSVADAFYKAGFTKEDVQTLNDWTQYPSHSIEARQVDVYAVRDYNKVSIADVTGIRAEMLKPVLSNPIKNISITNKWQIKKGELLSTGLNRWGKAAGWQVVWKIGVDYPMVSDVALDGSFVEASKQLLEAYGQMDMPVVFEPVYYASNKVLSVSLGE